MTSSDRQHVGDLLADLLLLHGVETIFGVPGGQTAAVYDAVLKRRDLIEHVIVRDERTAAYAADAYARLTGRVGVCDATVGPGAAKLPSGLGEALNSSIPVLALVSDLPSATEARRYRGATSQALDQETLLRAVTKWQATIRRPKDLAPLVRRAFREATTGRPGPVALVLPQDILDAPADEGADREGHPDVHAATFGRFPALRLIPDPEQIAGVVAVLQQARRPLLVLGGGAMLSGAADIVARVAESFGAAVATTLSGKGCIDERHPLSVGVLGSMGTSAARMAAEQADALIFVGSKAGSVATLSWSLPRPGQAVAQIDVDPAELGRDFPLDALALADARLALEAIAAKGATAAGPSSPGEWPATVRHLAGRWRQQRASEAASEDVPIRPQRVIAELQQHAGLNHVVDPRRTQTIFVSDASLASGWLGAYFEQTVPGRKLLFPRGLAGLGWALPAAIGAAVAAPDHRVVALVGDGALAYAVGELSVAVQRQLPITVVVLNNSSYGWIRWYRRIGFGRGWEQDDFGPTDFAAVASGYGLAAVRVDKPADLAPALESALAAHGPSLVDVVSSVWETPVAAHREALEAGTRGAYGT
jgi:acetolactate synthase-1/2/3 large subunit